MTISRRHLFSSGIAAGVTAVFPRQLLCLPSPIADSPLGVDLSHPGPPMDPAVGSPYSAGEQAAIRKLARDTITQLFAGKTLAELQQAGDLLGIPAAARVNLTLRHAERVRGSVSADGAYQPTASGYPHWNSCYNSKYGGC
jgi:hypothetical protein